MMNWNEKTVLVTGASGLVGTHTLVQLDRMGAGKIHAVIHRTPPQYESTAITCKTADLRDPEACRKLLEPVDVVMMFAAHVDRRPRNRSYLLDTLNMVFNMLDAASSAGVQKFLWTSTATAYPPSTAPVKESDLHLGKPYDAYAELAYMTRYLETLCHSVAGQGMDVVVIRPTAIYGEYGDFNPATAHILPSLIRWVVDRVQPLDIWGTGQSQRDYIHAEDVVSACIAALEKVGGYDCFNIGSGTLSSVRHLLETIIRLDGFEDARVTYDPTKEQKAPVIAVDIQKAGDRLGFQPAISLEEGIDRCLRWLRR